MGLLFLLAPIGVFIWLVLFHANQARKWQSKFEEAMAGWEGCLADYNALIAKVEGRNSEQEKRIYEAQVAQLNAEAKRTGSGKVYGKLFAPTHDAEGNWIPDAAPKP
jgi:hypothetical protein